MKTVLCITLFLGLGSSLNAQDTIRPTSIEGDFYIDYKNTIRKFASTNNCWRREEFVNDTLFSIKYLSLDKQHPIQESLGYYSNGNLAFQRSYFFDGEYSEAFGAKNLFYENGNLKEKGSYHHGIKYGNWIYYNKDASIRLWTQYDSPIADTISRFRYLNKYPNNIAYDTLTIETDSSFYDIFPCASFDKNGIEVQYKNGVPFEVRKYESGKLTQCTRKRWKMRKLIKTRLRFPDIKLWLHDQIK